MRLLTTGLLILFISGIASSTEADNDFAEIDGDFDEFDEFDGADTTVKAKSDKTATDNDFEDEDEEEFETKPKGKNFEPEVEDAVVEDVDSEFNHFADEEEFEGFNNDDDHEDEFEHMSTKGRGAKEKPRPTAAPPKTIKITNIPAHLRNNWENYYLEMLMVAGIVVYFLNFFTGKAKNQKIANSWFNSHKVFFWKIYVRI